LIVVFEYPKIIYYFNPQHGKENIENELQIMKLFTLICGYSKNTHEHEVFYFNGW